MFFIGKHFAVAGDFGGEYGGGWWSYTYMGGPAYVVPIGKSAMFNAHYLLGGIKWGPERLNTFAMAVGGALDFKVAKHVWVRPVQVDWILDDWSGTWYKKNFRYSGGVVFMFGK